MTTSIPNAAYLAESRVWQLYVFYIIAIPVELFTTALRLWAKKSRRNGPGGWGADDLLVVAATCIALAEIGVGLWAGPPHGLGRHIEAVSQENLTTFLMGDYIFTHLYTIANGTAKLSILAVYYRIFSTHRFRVAVLCTIAFVTAWMTVAELLLGFGCRPVRAFWSEMPPGEDWTCIEGSALGYFANVTNLVANVWIFGMPIPIIARLKMTLDKRIGLVFLFSIGLGTVAFSAVRMKLTAEKGSDDLTWNEVICGIVSVWEPGSAIVCANLPIIYNPIRDAFGKLGPRSKKDGSRTTPDMSSPSDTDADWNRLRNRGESSDTVADSSGSRRGGEEEIVFLPYPALLTDASDGNQTEWPKTHWVV